MLDVTQRVLAAPILEDLSPQGDHFGGNLYGEPNASYQLRTSTNLQQWSEGARVTLGRVPTAVSVPAPAGGGPVFLRADTF